LGGIIATKVIVIKMDTAKAYNVLLHTDTFYGPAVGAAGIVPETVFAFLSLLQTSEAKERFSSLLEEGTLAGQLYALCGLYIIDHEFFKEAVEQYRHLDSEVRTMFGCIASHCKVAELIESASPGAVRLGYPNQSLEEWRKDHQGLVEEYGFELDILGGGYTAVFCEVAKYFPV